MLLVGHTDDGALSWLLLASAAGSRRNPRLFAVPRYISSGVWPVNAECGIFALCSSTKKAMSVSR
jgi:hypothetical protein